jgi:5-carboxymethyl-2-hydroxymuconate isomerase
MPHLVILYTPNLDRSADEGGCDMTALCRAMAKTMCAQVDEAGKAVFPTGGVRVLAYPAAHYAVADGERDYAFVYLNLRMGRGRSAAVHHTVGTALETAARAHFAALLASRYIGITLQIDEGPEVFDAKNSSIHPLFQKPKKD